MEWKFNLLDRIVEIYFSSLFDVSQNYSKGRWKITAIHLIIPAIIQHVDTQLLLPILLATIFRAPIEIIHVMHAHRRSKRTNNYSQVAWRKRINHTSSTAIPFCSWRTDNECAINCTHISIHPHHTPPALRALIYSDYSRSGGLDCLDLPPLLIMPSDAETRESVRSWR